MYSTYERDIHQFQDKEQVWGVPTVAPWVKNLASVHEDVDSIPELAQWVKHQVLP